MGDRVQDAVDGLIQYMEQPKLTGLEFSDKVRPPPSGPDAKTALGEVLMSVMGTTRGSMTGRAYSSLLSDFITKSPALKSVVNEKIRMFVDGNKFDANSTMSKIVGPTNSKNLSIIQVDTIRVTPAARDVNVVVAFMNMIPTIELSRCIPYLTIDVQTGRPPLSSDGRVQGMSLMKFLGGAFDTTGNPGDRKLALSLMGKSTVTEDGTGQKSDVDVTISGMELFTSPQVLVNPDPAIDAFRAGPVIDRFRPYMSIERFEVELTPQVGFFAYRTANLDITLHDRSRLAEIADFIRPDMYGTVELLIEYGWHHPDDTSNNVFGTLLNAMRVKEKYGIINSSFNMTKSGEVKIKLRLFTRGMSDMQTVKIGESGEAIAAMRAVRNLQKTIAELKASVNQNSQRSNKEVRGSQVLFAGNEDIGATLALSPDAKRTLDLFIKKGKTTGDASKLKAELVELYGTKGKPGRVVALEKSIKDEITRKMNRLGQPNEKAGNDPFIFSLQKKLRATFGQQNESKEIPAQSAPEGERPATQRVPGKGDYIKTLGHVSLAKLMATFVGEPLAATKKYADVQLIFYPFNSMAGMAANYNIGEFPISVSELKKGLIAISPTKGLALTLREFVQYIANNFIDDMANPAYGLSQLYSTEIDKSGFRSGPKGVGKLNDDKTRLDTAVTKRLLTIGSQDGTMKMPQLDMLIETVPVASPDVGPQSVGDDIRTVLKIHFFDRCASAYESIGQLILGSREEDMRSIGEFSNNKSSDHAAVSAEIISRAKKALGGIERVQSTSTSTPKGVFDFKYDIEKLRAFIRQNVPTLVYGTNHTGIKEASFATIQAPLLSTVHMLRAGEAGPTAPTGLTRTNLPLRTLPARVSMTTIGCPLFHYMQQFFIDFNTNTTIDNIYGINKLTHEISPGKFETKIEFCPLDAYGRYESLPNQIGAAIKKLDAMENDKKSKK